MSIQYISEKRQFILNFDETTYAIQITDKNIPVNLYYGPRLEFEGDIPKLAEITNRRRVGSESPAEKLSEYAGWNSDLCGSEPALKATFADGTRDLQLGYVSHTITENSLRLLLRDEQYQLTVELVYTVYDDCGILERSAVIRNGGSIPAKLEVFSAAELHIPYRDSLRLTSLTGKWSEEYRITREKIRDGQTVLQTRGILSGPDAVPFFAIDEGDADERRGGVWFGTLLWSGTHKIIVEREVCGEVTVTAGVNNFDCEINLKPGDSYETPVLALGYTDGGFGAMSRDIHAYERAHIMDKVETERIMPVVYNAYGTFFAKINEEKIMSVIPAAQELGIEALIIDAGWAGEGENYAAGMGVWNENRERFPHGLKAISDELHRRGMIFGLWMEPECAHADSKLVKEHPDWVFGYPVRGAELNGVRYVLNFALDEVRDYIIAKIESLIVNCGVDYFKIDFNRRLYEVGTSHFADEDKKSVWIKYVDNLTLCYQTIKRKFPKLLFENCAGGGMRTDLSMLRFAGRINRSDNQDPLDILKIHEGFSYFMLPKLAGGGCHISDVYTKHHNGRISTMKYQANIAMMGSLAIGKNLTEITDDEKAELKGYIETYKSIRHIVHLGDIYRLASACEKPYAAFEYLSRDKSEGVVFVLGQSMQFMQYPENLRLDGLCYGKQYEVEGCGRLSGRALMRVGLHIRLSGDMDSVVIRFRLIQ